MLWNYYFTQQIATNQNTMRKVKLLMQMTINGFVGQPDGGMDWMTWNPDDDFLEFINSNYESSTTLLLGRKMADGFINHWQNVADSTSDHLFAKKIANMSKVVFTKTLDESIWKLTTLAKGNLAEEIANLKNQNGKDIIVIGGAGLVGSLIKEGLIDEYQFILNPTAIANGLTIFNTIDDIQKFTPIQAKLYSGGKIVLSYIPKKE